MTNIQSSLMAIRHELDNLEIAFKYLEQEKRRSKQPKISVICPNKNHDKYIEEAIQSVFMQKFIDYELIIMDGASTDNSLDIIAKYPQIILSSEQDKSAGEAIMRGVSIAKGDYIMFTTSTDGYLSDTWFSTAAKILDENIDISMVWANCQNKNPDGSLGSLCFFNNLSTLPPTGMNWFLMWLNDQFVRNSYLPELNYCVRTNIYKKLLEPSIDFPELNNIDPILRFHFEFNRNGYINQYVPISANFGRIHANQLQHDSYQQSTWGTIYQQARTRYIEKLASGQANHYIRNGKGDIIQGFSLTAL